MRSLAGTSISVHLLSGCNVWQIFCGCGGWHDKFLDLCCACGPKKPGLVLCCEQYRNFWLGTSQPGTKDLIQDWKHEPTFSSAHEFFFPFPVYFILILFLSLPQPQYASGNMEKKNPNVQNIH